MIDKKELWVMNGENQIYGEIYLPGPEDGKYPLVIFSHELGEDHNSGTVYALQLAAKGYAVYLYDFCGGSRHKNKSSCDSTYMSVQTEKSDLKAVMEAAKGWKFADMDNLVLMGASQGGFVSILATADLPQPPRTLILLYPALIIQDTTRGMFASREEIPEQFSLFHIKLSRRYALDSWDEDIYTKMDGYKGPVLLLHGDEDKLVPLSYPERAVKTFPNAQLEIIKDAGHIFHGEKVMEAAEMIIRFLAEYVPVHNPE